MTRLRSSLKGNDSVTGSRDDLENPNLYLKDFKNDVLKDQEVLRTDKCRYSHTV